MARKTMPVRVAPRGLAAVVLALGMALGVGAARAQPYEAAVAAELHATPAINAQVLVRLGSGEQVQVEQTRGGWARVRLGQVRGWVRMNRLRPLQQAVPAQPERLAGLFTADSTTPTATTGVRGLGKGWVRNSRPDPQAVQRMQGFAVNGAQLRNFAAQGGLHAPGGPAPARQERQALLDREFASVILGACPVLDDAQVQHYVNLVGHWLVRQAGAVAPAADLPAPQAWRFAVIVSDAVASFSTPGGLVFVTEGLLRQLSSEAELAAALAHEVAHVALRHQATALVRGGLAPAGGAPRLQVADAMERIYVRGMDAADEFAADGLALRLLARAGYSPGGMADLLRGYASAGAYDAHYTLLRQTHPGAQERLRRLERQLGAQDARAGVVQDSRYRAMRARL